MKPIIKITLLLSGIAYVMLSYFTVRMAFGQLMLLFGILFVSYWLLYRETDSPAEIKTVLTAGLFFRLLLLFALPNLSDDFYRFLWDGYLLVAGGSPFAHLPVDFFNGQYTGPAINGITTELLGQLNSPKYFTIYPPVCQFTFWLGCWLFPNSLYGATVTMKLVLLAFECGSVYLIWQLLQHFGQPSKRALLYALNPLVIVELCSNLHFEAAMIFFSLLSVWCLVKHDLTKRIDRYLIGSAVALAMAVCSKLLPLIFLPFIIRRLGWIKSIIYGLIVGLVTILCFAFFINIDLALHLLSSVELYFQKFEFNASIYYLCRQAGYWYIGWNMIATIGKYLALATFSSIILVALVDYIPAHRNKLVGRDLDLPGLLKGMMWALLIYLALATIVHPWYVTSLIAFCVFTNYRFPIVWSLMVLLSYYTYRTDAYTESMLLVGIAYVGVYGYLFYELFLIPKNRIE